MNIRLLNPADAETYQLLRLEALKGHPEAFASSYEEEKEFSVDKYRSRLQPSEESFSFGAFINDRLVGVVTLMRENKKKLCHRANIFAMYVAPDIRGIGAGKTLMGAAINQATELGVEQIYLTVESSNVPAIKLYESVGFMVYGKDKHSLKIGERYYDEDHMVLYL